MATASRVAVRPLIRRPSWKVRTAYHEAGHTVLAILLGKPFHYVTIAKSDDNDGHVKRADRDRNEMMLDALAHRDCFEFAPETAHYYIDSEMMVGLAGVQAEHILRGRQKRVTFADILGSGYGDYGGLSWLVSRKCIFTKGDATNEAEAYCRWLEIRTRDMLVMSWWMVHAIATALLDKETLSSTEVAEIIENREPALRFSCELINRQWEVIDQEAESDD